MALQSQGTAGEGWEALAVHSQPIDQSELGAELLLLPLGLLSGPPACVWI